MRAIWARETSDFPGRLGIQHWDVPFAVANGLADAGLLVHHLALYYAETFPKEFAVVSLPGAEQRSADIYAALADHPRNAKAAAWFLEYFFSRAPEAYQANGVRQTARRGIRRDAAPAAGRVGNERPRGFPSQRSKVQLMSQWGTCSGQSSPIVWRYHSPGAKGDLRDQAFLKVRDISLHPSTGSQPESSLVCSL